ncbi:PLP-dependent transferase [Trichocladium antarcticum]|uniref:PLP-dependent transferase n=1 Tax=Trichocladium antarcticum TaxID=1450529 RepID=A0AAN6UH10_9PEZI|nr:PLP-dependent transferase [Trichocladium antarcticum]
MAQSSILTRLSGRRHGNPKDKARPVARETSWRRSSLASLKRRIRRGHKPPSPSPKADAAIAQAVSSHDEPIECPYERPIEIIRQEEYSHMNNGTYLDHGGTTIYARSTVERFAQKMLTGLYGNPHSANEPAKFSGDMVDAVRLKALHFLGADPAHFDLIFTANATAAIKLVADAFRDLAEQTAAKSFWYGYHRDAHTSLVGIRELTTPSNAHVFPSNAAVESWLANPASPDQPPRTATLGLFAYPAQSNLTGRRAPLSWPAQLRHHPESQSQPQHRHNTYTLLDAAAFAMTAPLGPVFARPAAAPDFVSVAFYKILGFPDLGGLVVRRATAHVLALRRYFGGGTVTMVGTVGGAWHLRRGLSGGGGGGGEGGYRLHEGLEDGTLPFHAILALGEAMEVHGALFGGMGNVSAYTARLARRLYRGVAGLRYGNGQVLCRVYGDGDGDGDGGPAYAYGDATRQGPTLAFNVFRADGAYVSYAEVERLANEKGVYVRSGGVCCPGGVYTALQYEPWQLNRARSAGHDCGPNGLSVIHQLPTGVVRASLGAMSTVQDVDTFVTFLRETFIETEGHEDKHGGWT